MWRCFLQVMFFLRTDCRPSRQWELPQPLLSSFTNLQEAELDEYSCSVDDVCREPVLEEIIDDHGVDVINDQMADELDDGMFNYLTVHCRLLACLLVSLSLAKVA